MKKRLTYLLVGSLVALPALADKPEWAGTGKPPTAEQLEEHRDAMRNKNADSKGKKEVKQHDKAWKQQKERDRDNDDRDDDRDDDDRPAQTEIEKDIEETSEAVEQIRETGRKWWRFWEQNQNQ